MPDMGDDNFRETVIYLVGHGDEGAMGLAINQSLEDMQLRRYPPGELQLGDKDELIQLADEVKNRQVLRGGPVQTQPWLRAALVGLFPGRQLLRGQRRYLPARQPSIFSRPWHSTTRPARHYSRWAIRLGAPGQLGTEIQANGWLTVPGSRELLFGLPIENRYDAALASLGDHAGEPEHLDRAG